MNLPKSSQSSTTMPVTKLKAAIVSSREYLEELRSRRSTNGGTDTPAMAELSAVLDGVETSERRGDRRQKRRDIFALLLFLIFLALVFLRPMEGCNHTMHASKHRRGTL